MICLALVIFEYVSCRRIDMKVYQTDMNGNLGLLEESWNFTEGSIITVIILNWRPKMHSHLLFHGKIQRQCLSTENNWLGLKTI